MEWTEFRPYLHHFSAKDERRVERAFELGKSVHAEQRRMSGEPYFMHPIAVAHMLANMGADADTVIAALLHDSVEDTPITIADIDQEIGGDVGDLIEGVTKIQLKDESGNNSINGQIETLRKIFTFMEADVRIMIIKLVDRLHNMQTLRFLPPEKQKRIAKETLDVYVKIADRLSMQDLRDELEGLCLSVLEPTLYPQLLGVQQRNEAHFESIRSTLQNRIKHHSKDLRFDIRPERKTWGKLRVQLELGDSTTMGASATVLAFVCDDIEECYKTLGALHQLWHQEDRSFEDFLNAPVLNGYKGLHTTIILENGMRVRCKIRTANMQEYARKGVTLNCFGDRPKGLAEYLPWAEHISPLSRDTQDRSEAFWETLQNDILGESIIIYGPADTSALVPKSATALDAAFYLFGERAKYVSDLKVNGKAAPFGAPLTYASNVSASFADSQQVNLKWLQHVNTGVSAALIHRTLSEQDREKKVATGTWLLQEHLSSRGRGFISEFETASLERSLKLQGYGTLEDIYIRLAEGRLTAEDVEQAIFKRKLADQFKTTKYSFTLRCTIPAHMHRMLLDLLQYYQIENMKIIDHRGDVVTLMFALMLTEEESRALQQTLRETLDTPYALRRTRSIILMRMGSIALFLLWGFDPVLAHVLLQNPYVTPVDLTITRFLTLTMISGLLFMLVRARRPVAEARLSLRSSSLWLSALLLLAVAFTTYFSLEGTLPTNYTIPMTMAGVMMSTIAFKNRRQILMGTWLLILLGLYTLVQGSPGWSIESMAFTLLAVVSFTLFSIISERHKKREFIATRSAQYFFVLSFLCALLVIPLLPSSNLNTLPAFVIARMSLFSIVFVGLPYYIYYSFLSHREIEFVLRYSFFIIPMTMVGQLMISQGISPLVLLSGAIIALGASLPLYHIGNLRRYIMTNMPLVGLFR